MTAEHNEATLLNLVAKACTDAGLSPNWTETLTPILTAALNAAGIAATATEFGIRERDGSVVGPTRILRDASNLAVQLGGTVVARRRTSTPDVVTNWEPYR